MPVDHKRHTRIEACGGVKTLRAMRERRKNNTMDIGKLTLDVARYDGFVVLHGTDTMSYTASALSFLLENLAKPVVFTGSQIPIGVLRTDGRENLITAIEIAAAHDAEGPLVPEVSLYFQNRLFRANRTVKQSAEEFAAFRSYNYPALAEVGVNITFHRDYIHRPAHADAELRVAAALDDRVLVIRLFPGLREQVLRAMLSIEGLRAVVLETSVLPGSLSSRTYLVLSERAKLESTTLSVQGREADA